MTLDLNFTSSNKRILVFRFAKSDVAGNLVETEKGAHPPSPAAERQINASNGKFNILASSTTIVARSNKFATLEVSCRHLIPSAISGRLARAQHCTAWSLSGAGLRSICLVLCTK